MHGVFDENETEKNEVVVFYYYVNTTSFCAKMHTNALKRIHAITATREVYKTESTRVMPLVMDSRIRRHC